MKRIKVIQCAAAGIASLGMLVGPAVQAAEPTVTHAVTRNTAPAIIDVALLPGGVLQGQVVDAQGGSLAATTVSVQADGREVANATSDAKGYFSVAGLQGGMYQVSAAGSTGVCRTWTAETAPPAANQGVLIVSSQNCPATARGQNGNGPILGGISPGGKLLMLGVLGGIITAGCIAAGQSTSSS